MNKLEEIKTLFKELPTEYRNHIIFSLLKDEIISYEEISKMYVETLEEKVKKNWQILTSLSLCLSHYWSRAKPKTEKEEFIKAKAAYEMLKINVFKTAPIEKDFKEFLKNYKYSESENGDFRFEGKKVIHNPAIDKK